MASLPYSNASARRHIGLFQAWNTHGVRLNWRLLLAIAVNCVVWMLLINLAASLF